MVPREVKYPLRRYHVVRLAGGEGGAGVLVESQDVSYLAKDVWRAGEALYRDGGAGAPEDYCHKYLVFHLALVVRTRSQAH